MPLATLEGVQIYWEGYGRGEPVLFISGVSGGTWSWQDQIEAFSPHFRVVTFDNMGAGRSSKPDRPYSIAEMADQAAAVLHAANERRAYVVGLSMGGMIAQELTLRHPHLVSALVLGSTHCGGEARIPPGKVVIERFADNGGLSPEQIIDKNLQFLVSPEFLKDAPPALKRYRQRQLQAPLQPDYALQRQVEAISTFDSCRRLNLIRVPCLILTGGKDILVPPENGRLLGSRIAHALEVYFVSAGHLIHLESTAAFNAAISQFLQNVARPPGAGMD